VEGKQYLIFIHQVATLHCEIVLLLSTVWQHLLS